MSLFEAHRAMLDEALESHPSTAATGRLPGERRAARSMARPRKPRRRRAFEALLDKPFELDSQATGRVGKEVSPYGFALGITYPKPTPRR